MNADHQAVTVIGLGSMGSDLASALLDRGHPTTVWNRTAEKARPLADRGAHPATTPREAITASPLVPACVLDYEVLRSVPEPVAEAHAGKALVNLTQARRSRPESWPDGPDPMAPATSTARSPPPRPASAAPR